MVNIIYENHDRGSISNSFFFSGSWGYYHRFKDLAGRIKAAFPTAQVEGFVGRTSKQNVMPYYNSLYNSSFWKKTESFEVIINDKLIHSKLESGIIPNFDEMVQIVMTFKED